jgi:short-subunit dehydrogenase
LFSADYSASKAGLLAFHASLKAELKMSNHAAAKNVKTVIVTPGQLGTPLFEDIKTPSNFLAPIVEPVDLAKEIVRMIDSGESGEIRMPFYSTWIPLLLALPVGVQAIVRNWSGLDQAMIKSIKDKNS